VALLTPRGDSVVPEDVLQNFQQLYEEDPEALKEFLAQWSRQAGRSQLVPDRSRAAHQDPVSGDDGDEDERPQEDEEGSEVQEVEQPPNSPTYHLEKWPQKRKAPEKWTDKETTFLTIQIAKFGPKWSDLARMYGGPGGELAGRDQTALKDKARNIMRLIIEEGKERQWYKEFPMWQKVSVGSSRRGVHNRREWRPLTGPEKHKLAYLLE
jgi:hypothetical protein